MSEDRFLEKLKVLGVKDPNSPTTEELALILQVMLKDKEIKSQTIRSYLENANIALENYYDALKTLSADARKIGEKAMDLIQQAIHILGANLLRKDLKPAERSEVRNQISELTAKAVEIHHRQSKTREAMVITGGGLIAVLLALIGTIIGKRDHT